MAEELLEAEAIEEDVEGDVEGVARPLPAERPAGELTTWSGDARTVAIAAAGGIVAGAATVAVVKAASRAATPNKRSRKRLLRREKGSEVIASRSFLVDVHLLGNK